MTGLCRPRSFLPGLALLSGLVTALMVPLPSQAGSLNGDTIKGSLGFCDLKATDNNFTPTSGIGPIEFDHLEGDGGSNNDTAVFSATQLTIQDQVSDFACGWGMTFTDVTTPFPMLDLVSSNFSDEFTFDLSTDGVITIQWTGAEGPQTFTAVFDVELPEPGSLMLFGVGVAGVGLIRRPRRWITRSVA